MEPRHAKRSNHAPNAAATALDLSAMLKLFHSKPRKPQIQHWYSHCHWDERIAPTYRTIVANAPSHSTDSNIKLVAPAIEQCWAAEPQDFKTALKEEVDALYAGQLRDWDTLANAADGIGIDPKERAR
jgi:hypothetical protein